MDAFAAGELRGHCAQGQTVPLYLACNVEGKTVVYQTKLAGRRSGLSTRELGVELLGTTIAHDAGLHVARPAMITLPAAIIDQIEAEYRFGIEDATAFGVVWKAALTPFLPEVEVGRLSDKECATLLSLDLLLTNGDRTEPNPNVCWEGEGLLVFDFEHCLELPKGDFERRLAVHLETLGPTLASHLVSGRIDGVMLRRTLEDLLERLAVEALSRDGYALSGSWREDWIDNVEYLGYIRRDPEAFLDRIESLRP